jgi:hypothetical protein
MASLDLMIDENISPPLPNHFKPMLLKRWAIAIHKPIPKAKASIVGESG